MVDVEMLPLAVAGDAATVEAVCALVNRAYSVAELGLWREPYERTTPPLTAESIAREELAVARRDGRIVGSICTFQLDAETGWCGALAVDPALGGRGLGATLMRFAEERAAAAGAQTMQLEVLAPRPPIPHTDLITAWYVRRGYREVGRFPLAEIEPDAVPFLATVCDVSVMQKPLTG